MRFRLLVSFAAILLLLAGCTQFLAGDGTSSSAGGIETVEMTIQGFVPATLEIPVGTTVVFVNKDTEMHWPASGVHPTHQICAGFDSLKGVESGKSYSYTFTTAKTCPYHDHMNPGLKGTIVVK